LAKCNIDKNTQAVYVHAGYTCVTQKSKPVLLMEGYTPDAELTWRERAITHAIGI
jgi:hypothetical protein